MTFRHTALVILALATLDAAAEEPGIARRLIHACDVYDEKAMAVACAELVARGDVALLIVRPLLDHADANVRWQATRVLGDLGIHAPGLPQQLETACRDSDADVRAAAILSLAAIDPDTDRAVRIATRLCHDPHDLVRANAWRTRWQLRRAPRAIDALVALLTAKDWLVAAAAKEHLIAIGAPAIPAVLGAASPRCIAALEVLGLAEPHPIEQRGQVIEKLEVLLLLADDPPVSTAAALALARLAAGERLQTHANHANTAVRVRVIDALGRMSTPTPDDGRTALILRRALTDSSAAVQVAAISALGHPGNAERETIEALTPFLQHPDPDLRGATIAALGRQHPVPPAAIASLTKLAQQDPKDHLRSAARALLKADR